MQLLKVYGQQRIASQNSKNLSSILVSAIQSKNQYIEKSGQKIIVFSTSSLWQSFYRFDCFCGVRRGEIKILPETEGKSTISFSLDISTSSFFILMVMLGNMIIWPLYNAVKLSTLIKDEITILLISLAVFFLWREYIRLTMKLFINQTLKHLK